MKNRKSDRILWVLIATLLLCVCVPVVAIAEETPYFTIRFLDGLNGKSFQATETTLPQGTTLPDVKDLPYTSPGATSPSCSGYTFNGWEPSMSDNVVQGNVTYVARWTINSSVNAYMVVYKDGIGTPIEFPRQENGWNMPLYENETGVETPDRQNYSFKGWSCKINGIPYPDAETLLSKNDIVGMKVTGYTVFTAEWDEDLSQEPSNEPEQSQGPIYYPDYDESPVVTPVPTPTPEPVADEEDVSPKTGAAEASLPALAVVALSAVAMAVRMMRKRNA